MVTADGTRIRWSDYMDGTVGYNIRNREYLKQHSGLKCYVRDLIREVDRHPTDLLKEVKREIIKERKGDCTYVTR